MDDGDYREAYGYFACNGLLFNHESPLRGETFVTRKVTRAVAAIGCGATEALVLGNLDARRDWGHARDYVRAQWLMLQQDAPCDYVIGTGQSHSVRELAERAFARIGVVLEWVGTGADEIGVVASIDAERIRLAPGDVAVRLDRRYLRPTEVDTLLADASKAQRELGWVPSVSFEELVDEMVDADLKLLGPAQR